MISDRGSNNLIYDKSNWKTTIIRWLVWLGTVAGSIVNLWLLYTIFVGLLHQWALDATAAEMRKLPSDPTWNPTGPIQVEYGWKGIGLVIAGVIAISFTVIDEVYLRRGEIKGELWKRIGIMVGAQVLLFIILYAIVAITGYRIY